MGPNGQDLAGRDGESTPESKITSVYSDLGFEKCETVKETKVGDVVYTAVAKCKGVAGYGLELLEVDARQSINVLFPDSKKHELKFQKVVSPAFSEVGERAEWRVVSENRRMRPIALIIRLTVDQSLEDPDKGTSHVSYLTVSKITDSSACVTNVVDPGPHQNVKARELASTSVERSCLTEYPWLPKGDI